MIDLETRSVTFLSLDRKMDPPDGQAHNYDAALASARPCPPGHTIKIRELATNP
jgi:hypothetical protein